MFIFLDYSVDYTEFSDRSVICGSVIRLLDCALILKNVLLKLPTWHNPNSANHRKV